MHAAVMTDRRTIPILGTPIDVLDWEVAVARISEWARATKVAMYAFVTSTQL